MEWKFNNTIKSKRYKIQLKDGSIKKKRKNITKNDCW